MSTNDFFREIEHAEVPWRDYKLHVPVFYPDIMFMTASILAPLEGIRAILPSTRLKPYRITPWHGAVSLTAYCYRESDIGPYNEFLIGVPVTIDRETPIFTGILRRTPAMSMSYIHCLPVTTEIARVVGAEFAGYPKFVADIEFSESGAWLTCELGVDGRHILTMRGRKLPTVEVPRYRANPLTFRNGTILRSQLMLSEREMGMSRSGDDVTLELGDHEISEELRGLNLGRVLMCGYCPHAQGILTPVIESFAG